jgi:hypothetical protein
MAASEDDSDRRAHRRQRQPTSTAAHHQLRARIRDLALEAAYSASTQRSLNSTSSLRGDDACGVLSDSKIDVVSQPGVVTKAGGARIDTRRG